MEIYEGFWNKKADNKLLGIFTSIFHTLLLILRHVAFLHTKFFKQRWKKIESPKSHLQTFSLPSHKSHSFIRLILQVMIMDDGEPQLSSTTRVVIIVEDVNDNAPEFDQKTYNVEVPSNAKLNQKLFQVSGGFGNED